MKFHVFSRLFQQRSFHVSCASRKWVLQDDIQEAVWRTILRGPRPPSNKWEMRSKSEVSKTHSTFSKGVSKKDPPASMKPVQAKATQKGHPWQGSKSPKPREPLSPDQAMEAARARVLKLQGVLTTLGEDDEMYPTILEALKKAQSRAQERPVSERIQSTQSFVDRKRKRVERAKEIVAKARDTLASAIADQEQQEALLADGERSLAELKVEEKAVPSPFKSDPPHIAPEEEEFKRLQETIVGLQQELANLRARQLNPTMVDEDDDDVVLGLPHKKTKVGPSTPLAITSVQQKIIGTPT